MKNKIISFALCLLLVFCFVACGEKEESANIGTERTFTFLVTDLDGNSENFEITTKREYVGEALFDEKLIEGEEGQFGLYVKKVNGILADYDVTGTYWAFYEDGKYAASGADTTKIKEDVVYEFRISK